MAHSSEAEEAIFARAVRVHAEYLGIDDEKYLGIAKEALMADLPEGWAQAVSEDNGKPYYYNHKMGESSWEHPLDNHYREMYQRLKREEEQELQSDGHHEDIQHDTEGRQEEEEAEAAAAAAAVQERQEQQVEEQQRRLQEQRVEEQQRQAAEKELRQQAEEEQRRRQAEEQRQPSEEGNQLTTFSTFSTALTPFVSHTARGKPANANTTPNGKGKQSDKVMEMVRQRIAAKKKKQQSPSTDKQQTRPQGEKPVGSPALQASNQDFASWPTQQQVQAIPQSAPEQQYMGQGENYTGQEVQHEEGYGKWPEEADYKNNNSQQNQSNSSQEQSKQLNSSQRTATPVNHALEAEVQELQGAVKRKDEECALECARLSEQVKVLESQLAPPQQARL
jgi:hypothetical protein